MVSPCQLPFWQNQSFTVQSLLQINLDAIEPLKHPLPVGNSLSALLDGSARLTLLPRGEDYIITMPYAHCKGILLGTLTMEMGGEVCLKCEKTGYRADLEFKLKVLPSYVINKLIFVLLLIPVLLQPMIGGADFMNYVTGKLRLGKETLAIISGYWDDCITIEDKRTGEKQTLWNPTSEVRAARLKRWTVAVEEQLEYESDKLWSKVAAAIRQENQVSIDFSNLIKLSVHFLFL